MATRQGNSTPRNRESGTRRSTERQTIGFHPTLLALLVALFAIGTAIGPTYSRPLAQPMAEEPESEPAARSGDDGEAQTIPVVVYDDWPTSWFGFYETIGGEAHAVPDGVWTFDHGAADPWEGWTSVNMSLLTGEFWSLPEQGSFLQRNPNMAEQTFDALFYAGNHVLWCGLDGTSADSLCWEDGLGYDDSWRQRVTSPTLFNDPDSNEDLVLKLPLIYDTEPDFDSLLVLLIADGVETQIAGFDGQELDGERKEYLSIGSTLGSAEEFQVAFEFHSDAGWSDADGFFDSIVGAGRLDNIEVEGRGQHVLFSFDGGPRDAPAFGQTFPVFGAKIGFSMSSCDVNGDGVDDLIAGAPFYSNGEVNEGAVYVFLVASNGTFVLDKILEFNRTNAYFGTSVAGLGDVDGDGYDDVLIGAPFHTPNGISAAGGAFLYRGGPSGISTAPSWSALGTQANSLLGLAVASAGDVNHDGYGDVVIGTPAWDNGQIDEGRADVYLGGPGGLATSPVWSMESDLDNAHAGWALAGGGDLDQDSYDDILIGIPFSSSSGFPGAVQGFSGTPTGIGGLAFNEQGHAPGSSFGASVAFSPNAGSRSTVVVGAIDEQGSDGIGALYIYAPLQGEVRIGPEDDDATIFGYLGNVVAGGDFNGDGYGDVLAGSPGNQGGSGGRALVYAGGPRGFQYAKHPIWVGGVWPNIDPIDFGRSVCALRIDGSGRDAVGVSAPEYASGQGLLRTYVSEAPSWEGWTRDPVGVPNDVGLAAATDYSLPSGCGVGGQVIEAHDANFEHPEGQWIHLISPIIDIPSTIEMPWVHVRYDAFLDLPYYDGVGFRFLVLGRKICPQTGLPAWEPTYEPGSPVVAGWPLQCAAQEYVIEVECGRDWDALRVILEIRQDCEWYSGEPSLCTGNSNLSPLLDNLQVGFHEGNVRTLEVFTFFDVNGNGVRDLPESAAIPDALVAVDPEGLAAITGSEGRVQFEGLSAHAHTVTAVPPPNWEVTTSGGAPVPIDLADCPPPPSTLTRLDIGMRPVENQSDLRISAWAIRAKAGSGTQFEGGWMNWGSTTQNVTVSASIPPQIIVNYVDPTPTGGTLNNPVWSYPSVPPGAVHYFTILGDVPSSTPLGAVLTSTFQVEPIAGDVSPANNVVQVEQTVVGPLDPNDKEVFPAGPIPPDQLITYVVHFQNVGTAEATNIVITDDLDPNLNIATLIQGAASHLHSFDVNGRTLRWTFENIDLPPQSEDDVGSQGFVTFQVRPADGIPAGTQIDNSAVITFDFADPIETNVVSSWVVDPADVDPEPADDGATVHFALTSLGPNPITRTMKMEFAVPGPGEVTVDLIDASGRKVWSSQERATPGTYSVRWDGSAGDAGPLPEGVYFARGRFQGDDGTSAAAGRRVVLLRQ